MRPSLSILARSVIAGLLLGSIVMGCGNDELTDKSPDGAFQLFLDSMQQYDRTRALELLAPESRRELEERARRASRQAGREIETEKMLVVERFVMRWEIDRMESEIDGDRAVVTVYGKQESQRAEVELLRADDTWKVILPL